MSLPIDLTQHFIAWHSSPLNAREAIERDGIRIMREAVWVSLHPGMPIAFARKHTGPFILSCLVLPHTHWQWGWQPEGNYILDTHEGTLNMPVTRAEIAEIMDEEAAMQHIQTGDSAGDARYPLRVPNYDLSMQLYGYAGWLDEHSLLTTCADVLGNLKARAAQHALAGIYWHYLNEAQRMTLEPLVLRAMGHMLFNPAPLDASIAAVALKLLSPYPDALRAFITPDALAQMPRSRRYLLWAAMQGVSNAPTFEETMYQIDPAQHANLTAIAQALHGQSATFNAPDKELAAGLVDIMTHGGINNAAARALLVGISHFPSDLLDAALITLLQRIRWVPSRTRNEVMQLLWPHREQLAASLQRIAQTQHGRPAQMAARLLEGLTPVNGCAAQD